MAPAPRRPLVRASGRCRCHRNHLFVTQCGEPASHNARPSPQPSVMLVSDFQKPFQLVIASTWMCRTIAITETRGSSSFYENSMATYSAEPRCCCKAPSGWGRCVPAHLQLPPVRNLTEESEPAAMSGSSGLSPMMFSFFHLFLPGSCFFLFCFHF